MLDDIIVQSIGSIDDVIITGAHNPFSSAALGLSSLSGTAQNQNGDFDFLSGPPPVVLQ